MRRILTSVGAMAAAGLLTVGLTTPASAYTGSMYVTQNGQTTVYNNPPARACIKSDPAKGEVTFTNRTDTFAYVTTDDLCRKIIGGDYFLRKGQARTLPAGTSLRIPD